MKVNIISNSDNVGGAARAAYRLHRSLINNGIESRMRVLIKNSDDWTVYGPKGKIKKLVGLLRPPFGSMIQYALKTSNINSHSGNWLPSSLSKIINASDCDVVNMHWVAGETLSIEDIGRINKPLIWTIHDMWAFSGTEHHGEYGFDARWRSGYNKKNRPHNERGIDLNAIAWKRKIKSFQNDIQIVAPSQWLASCARGSKLFGNNIISVIPNPININIFRPYDMLLSKDILGLPIEKSIILFGAMGGGKDPNKGYDLLVNALQILSRNIDISHLICAIFGQSEPEIPLVLPIPIVWMGHLYDDYTLSLLYSASSVMVVPSRQENLPQTATEAQACACPVVAFNSTGLPDAVEHAKTGYLAKPYDCEDLAQGIQWVLEKESRRVSLSMASRERAICLWAPEKIVSQYLSVYQNTLKQNYLSI
jgi:glycosyltransferase involved in cell wall biosynthesis